MGDREQFWQAHVDACRVSGITQKAYCERNGITPKTFRAWRTRLAGATGIDGEPHGGEVREGAKEFLSPSFDLRASYNCGTKCHVPSLEEGVETAETPSDGFRAGWFVAA